MCNNRTTNRKINRLHERCLRIIYNDKQSSFKILLEKDSSVSIHDRNIHCLTCSQQYFYKKNSHPSNLRLNSQFSRALVRSVFQEPESISYLGPVIWDIFPETYLILVFLKTGLKIEA